MINSVLESAAQKVMRNTSPAQFTIKAHFISSNSEASFSFYPFHIEQILINRDYLENWGDEIDLTMKVSPKDYALLQDQGQNLLCVLTISYVSKDQQLLFTPPPIQKQYHVLINDARDVRMAVPDIQMYTEASTSITVRLVEPSVYALRHVRINTVFQNATVTQAIYGVTQKFGITKIEMVAPDNVHQYDHIDIPSHQGIESVYQYLQYKFGVYDRGSSCYLTDGVLYVYPPFETAPIYDRTAIFYQVETGSYGGSHIYHRVTDDNVSIVINTQPESYDLSIAGSENIGTGFIFTRSSRSTDGYTQDDGSNGVTYTPNSMLSVSLDNSRTSVKGTNNIRHIKTTDNPYPAMSEIISHQASIMKVTWMHADPFQLDPGHAISYYYDQNEKMVKKTGILEHATYAIKPMSETGNNPTFGSVGVLTLRLSPNASIVI
jgi:hypothetical protein